VAYFRSYQNSPRQDREAAIFRTPDKKAVKSAQRVLEVLEYMSDDCRSVKVMDLSRALGYPQSSTSELLSSLVHLGYLRLDRANRTFHPTARIAALGRMVRPELFGKGTLVELLEAVNRQMECPVLVAMFNQTTLELVCARGFDRPLSRLVRPNPLRSSMGKVLLAEWSEQRIRALIHRLSAEEHQGEPVLASAFMDQIAQVRAQGYATTPSAAKGRQTVSIALPTEEGDPLSLAVLLPAELDASATAAMVDQLRSTVDQFLLGGEAQAHPLAPDLPLPTGPTR
jgi:DNA-binding IclR family transcriptional regulator